MAAHVPSFSPNFSLPFLLVLGPLALNLFFSANPAEIKSNQALEKTFVSGENLCEMAFPHQPKKGCTAALEMSKEHWRLDQTQAHTS